MRRNAFIYVRREAKERGVRPRLLDWLIPIQFDTEDGGNTFLQKSDVHLCHYIASRYRKTANENAAV